MLRDDSSRGVIRNRDAAKRLRSFASLRYGSITPTDIDVYAEFQDKLFVFTEAKNVGVSMPRGQQLALERLVDRIEKSGAVSCLLVASHDRGEDDVDVGGALVTKYRFRGKWLFPQEQITVRQAVDKLRELAGLVARRPEP